MNKLVYTFLILVAFTSCKETNTEETLTETSNIVALTKEQFETSKASLVSIHFC